MKRIPKNLHLYWDRTNSMSLLQTFTVSTFHKLNPDWNITVYVPKQKYLGQAKFIPDYTGKDYFSLIESMEYISIKEVDLNQYGISCDLHDILRSDILRYQVLYNVGGVWSDFDILWLRPITHFYNIEYYGDTTIDNVSAVVSFIHGNCGGHSIGVLIHRQHDPYVGSIVKFATQVKPPYGHESFGGNLLNAHYPDLNSLQTFKNVIGVPFETYYPYSIHPPTPTISKLYLDNDLSYINRNNVICLHWYNGHILSKQYVNDPGGFSRDCSMTTILKNVGCI